MAGQKESQVALSGQFLLLAIGTMILGGVILLFASNMFTFRGTIAPVGILLGVLLAGGGAIGTVIGLVWFFGASAAKGVSVAREQAAPKYEFEWVPVSTEHIDIDAPDWRSQFKSTVLEAIKDYTSQGYEFATPPYRTHAIEHTNVEIDWTNGTVGDKGVILDLDSMALPGPRPAFNVRLRRVKVKLRRQRR